MHIALFLHSLSTGGAQRRSIMLANGLAARGHRVDLVTAVGGGPQAGLVANNVNPVALAPGSARDVAAGGARAGELLSAIRPLCTYLRDRHPAMLVAMANHAVLPAVMAHGLAAKGGTRLVLRASNHLSRQRTGGPSLRRLAESWLWRRADGILAVSDDVARDAARLTGLGADRIISVPSPILPDGIALPRRSVCPDGLPAEILAMGRFVRQKGFDTLLRGFALLLSRRPAHLTLAGDGPDGEALKALCRELGIRQHVSFPGLVSNPFQRMAAADLFVLSSRWEGMPGVLVEAMATGCPAISTDCPGGSRELLRHGALGPLVPVDDPAALAEGMDAALSHPVAETVLRDRIRGFTVAGATAAYEQALLSMGGQTPTAAGTGRLTRPAIGGAD
ncbi:glycosyltransferase [Niveispirillum sp.]|uniref:glycosyltransferase n=1 Tax=Niveispirillum sp. TaxID=1917217 RepID=UPI001B7571DC|nr:glycosyltransferase [Niveispirillum sp.]MBP7334731.1 glycosyltransferase [Niveispirillum sp.]